ncbi:MAG: polysaccharide biosynthesis tyrosine autokinase [Actinomycetota bacterium]|nr:polysaccharide biosynthesis tyrosine autokinase [Actinomycetota bacterium]
MPSQSSSEMHLRDYVGIVRRRKGVVFLVLGLSIGLALAASFLQSPVYEGRARLLLQPRTSESLFDPNSGQRADPSRSLQTEIEVLKSRPVREQVRNQLGVSPQVSARPVGQTDVIEVVAHHGVPKTAADVANASARLYINFRRQQTIEDLLAASEQIQRKMTALQAEIDAASGAQRDALIQQHGLFKQKLDQLQVDTELKRGGAQLVAESLIPTDPVAPRPARYAAFALVLGGALGIGLALFREYLDDSVKSKEDVERIAPGVPVIGLIPVLPGWRDPTQTRVVSMEEPTSPVAEAYRSLRTSVQFLSLQRPVGTIMLTSPNAQEGKTTTLANLGVALARAGLKVVLVCCDLRRPRLYDFFGLSNSVGFTSVLLGNSDLATAVQPVPGVDRLHLLASGPLPPNPSELLATHWTTEVFESLQDRGFTVLIDAPPLLPVTDGLVLARHVDVVLMVSVAGATSRKDLARAVELLGQANAPLAGAVLNGVTQDHSYGYDYQYYAADARKSRRSEAAAK